jgi:ATP-dependent 26S proteasome regulatory subunit
MTPRNKISSVPTVKRSVFDDYIYDLIEKGELDLVGLKQFTTSDGNKFYPSGATVARITPGIYDIQVDNMKGIFFNKIKVKTDGLLRFPETNSEAVIEEISKFWEREHVFKKYNLNYKRGIFLYGPAGSGKSSTIQLICEDVIKREGVVFKFTSPGLFCDGLRIFREIQPDTPVVVLMEDVDSIVESYNESDILNILDGVDQISKVVYLATSNYPERLGQRLLNRPSRFDKRFKMGHPKKSSRVLYFNHLIDEKTQKEYDVDLDKWVEDTENMSVAHMKELFVSVCILGNPYEEAIEILRNMMDHKPRSDEDNFGKIGFKKPC